MSVRSWTNDYLDGRLPPEKRAAFEAALADDAELAREVADLEATIGLLRAMPRESAPASLEQRIMSQVRTQPIPRRRALAAVADLFQPRRLVLATAAAAVLLVGLMGLPEPEERAPRHTAAAPSTVTLSAADQAFVQECLRDYHVAVAGRLDQAGSTVEDPLSDGGLGL